MSNFLQWLTRAITAFGTPDRTAAGECRTTLAVAVVVEPDDGGFHAYTPGLPGIHADGPTEQAALDAVGPLIALYLASLAKHGEPLPVGPNLHDMRSHEHLRVPPAGHLTNIRVPWPSLAASGSN